MESVRLINHRRFLSPISSLKREKVKEENEGGGGFGKRRLPNNIFKLEKRSRELARLKETIEDEYKNTLIPFSMNGQALLCSVLLSLTSFLSAAANAPARSRNRLLFSMEKWNLRHKGFFARFVGMFRRWFDTIRKKLPDQCNRGVGQNVIRLINEDWREIVLNSQWSIDWNLDCTLINCENNFDYVSFFGYLICNISFFFFMVDKVAYACNNYE